MALFEKSKHAAALLMGAKIGRILMWTFLLISLLVILDYLTLVKVRMDQIDIRKGFNYHSNIPNLSQVIDPHNTLGLRYRPLYDRYSAINYLHKAVTAKDAAPHGLLIVVKSAVGNFEKRESIRQTWLDPKYLKHSQLSPNLPTKFVFITGLPSRERERQMFEIFPREWHHRDIVVADFVDSYGNNTYKTILALRWADEFPGSYQHLFLVDDDMYVDVVNLVNYLNNFPHLTFEKEIRPDGAQMPFYRLSTTYNPNRTLISGSEILADGLYMGQVYYYAMPLRESNLFFRARKSEWGVSLWEYPYNFYPSYIPGAAIIFSELAVTKFYRASHYIKPFKIDDGYLGIIAAKLGIIPVNNHHFIPWYPEEFKIEVDTFTETIAIHGFDCIEHMLDLWWNRDPEKPIPC